MVGPAVAAAAAVDGKAAVAAADGPAVVDRLAGGEVP